MLPLLREKRLDLSVRDYMGLQSHLLLASMHIYCYVPGTFYTDYPKSERMSCLLMTGCL